MKNKNFNSSRETKLNNFYDYTICQSTEYRSMRISEFKLGTNKTLTIFTVESGQLIPMTGSGSTLVSSVRCHGLPTCLCFLLLTNNIPWIV